MATTIATTINAPTKTSAQRKHLAKLYCEQEVDALRVADAHLESIHSSEAAHLSADVKRQVRELRSVLRTFPK